MYRTISKHLRLGILCTDNANLLLKMGEWSEGSGLAFMAVGKTPGWLRPFVLRCLPGLLKSRVNALVALMEKEIEECHKTFDPEKIRGICDAAFKDGDRQRVGLHQMASNFIIFGDNIMAVTMLLNWMVVYLIRYPKYQEKIYREVAEVMEYGDNNCVTLEQKSRMPLTSAFVEEVLRVVSLVGTTVGQVALQDTTLRGYRIPKNTVIRLNMYAISHDPETFKNPHQFRPERYIVADENSTKGMLGMHFSIGGLFFISPKPLSVLPLPDIIILYSQIF